MSTVKTFFLVIDGQLYYNKREEILSVFRRRRCRTKFGQIAADFSSWQGVKPQGVAELRRGFVDDEGTVQMRAGGGLRFTEVPGES